MKNMKSINIHPKDNKIITIVLGLIIVGLVVTSLFVFGDRSSKSAEANDTSAATTSGSSDMSDMNMDSMDMDMGSEDGSGTATVATGSAQVDIDNYMFGPMTTTIKTGSTVTWTNKDTVKHNVVADQVSASSPNSALLARGESYTFKFDKAGTYAYHCDPHPYMKARVIVTD